MNRAKRGFLATGVMRKRRVGNGPARSQGMTLDWVRVEPSLLNFKEVYLATMRRILDNCGLPPELVR